MEVHNTVPEAVIKTIPKKKKYKKAKWLSEEALQITEKRGWIIQPEGKRKNDMVRPSFGEQGPHFIFQSSFYTLSYA